MDEVLTSEDLNRVFIRAQQDDGKWVSIHAGEATDTQFDTWARTRMAIEGTEGPWSLAERADFCNQLYQQGALHVLKKGIHLGE